MSSFETRLREMVTNLPTPPATTNGTNSNVANSNGTNSNVAARKAKAPKAPPPPPPPPPMADGPVHGAQLLDDITEAVRSYIVISEEARIALALWILHTYAHAASFFTPYMHVTSPVKECGKTSLLSLIEALALRAEMSGRMSPAAMYRYIELNHPTLLLDEIDTVLKQDGAENLRNVLNSGFRADGKVHLCVGDGHEVKSYPTFCPKVISGIGGLWDTVRSRSIPIRLERATSDQRRALRRLRGDRIHMEMRLLRLSAARWAHDHMALLREADPSVPDSLGARASDIWRPLLAIADAAGGVWPDYARAAAMMLSGDGHETDDGVLLLEDVGAFVADDPARVAHGVVVAKDLHDYLLTLKERPWPTFDVRTQKELTRQGLASLFRRFHIEVDTHRIGYSTVRGYSWAKIADAIERYATPVIPVTPQREPDGGRDAA